MFLIKPQANVFARTQARKIRNGNEMQRSRRV